MKREYENRCCSANLPGSGYDEEEIEFLRAMQAYTAQPGHKFPAFTEVLAVLKSLGYRKEIISPVPVVEKESSAVRDTAEGLNQQCRTDVLHNTCLRCHREFGGRKQSYCSPKCRDQAKYISHRRSRWPRLMATSA